MPFCYLKAPYYPMGNANQVPQPNDLNVYQNSHLQSRAHHQSQIGQMLLINPNFNPNNTPLNSYNTRTNSILPSPQSIPGLGNNPRFTNYPFTINGSASHHHLDINQMYHVGFIYSN